MISRILRLPTRLGYLIEEDGFGYLARSESMAPDNVLALLQAAASTWRIAAGPRAGRKVLTLVVRGEQRPAQRTRELCSNHQGFRLHAGVQSRLTTGRALRQAQHRHSKIVPLHRAPGDSQRTPD